MNLQNYLKHADGCELKSAGFLIPDEKRTCTCSLASIQSRLVLLPDGLNQIILEILHDNATSVPVEGGWNNVKGIRADDFNTVAEDIVKAVKGEGR